MFEFIIGNIKPENVFRGNIKKCTKSNYKPSVIIKGIGFVEHYGSHKIESKLYKENATLIKIKNGGYVDLDNLNSILDYIQINKDINKNGYRLGIMMTTSPSYTGDLFVDINSLQPYYTEIKEQKIKKVKVKQLKLNQKSKDINH